MDNLLYRFVRYCSERIQSNTVKSVLSTLYQNVFLSSAEEEDFLSLAGREVQLQAGET